MSACVEHVENMTIKTSESKKGPAREKLRSVPELTSIAACCGMYICGSRVECVRLGLWPDPRAEPGGETTPADGQDEGEEQD